MRFLFFLSFFLIGCGYKTAYEYQQNIIKSSVNPIVYIKVDNPKESIFLKDALINAIYTVFDSSIDKNSKNKLVVNLSSFNLVPIDFDKNSFPILYRSKVSLNIKVFSDNKVYTYNVVGTYDFAVNSNTVLNENQKLNSFKVAAVNALNKFQVLIIKDGVLK